MTQKELFDKLYALDVSGQTEKKNGLTYLSWAWAWAEFKKACPDAVYEVVKNPEGLPYFADPQTGYMVYTRVTACGVTHEMWLPVMDYKNKALQVGQCSMFDVNKAIMRCLTKNVAMFGLGLYIYAGEDLPDVEIHCTECNAVIKGGKDKNGQMMNPAQVAAKTKGLCVNCFMERQAEHAALLQAAREQTNPLGMPQ